MAKRKEEVITITTRTAVRQTGLGRQVIQECVERRLVRQPLSDADLVELRRIRRLQELGVNMPGIEVILHLRRRLQVLQAELARRQGTTDG
jgi:hypothetical protein